MAIRYVGGQPVNTDNTTPTPIPAVAPPPDTSTPMKRPLGPPPTATPSNQPNPLVDMFKTTLSDLPYYNTPAFQELVNRFAADPNRTIQNQNNANDWKNQLQGWANTFATQFQNQVGRQPTADEYNTFFEQVVNTNSPWNHTPEQSTIEQGSEGLLKNAFSSTVADAQQQKATNQANAAVAPGSAFDQWQQAYTSSLNDTEKALTDYQTRLFEKLRPQLLTSLQSQGLLDSGALNEAFAGAASDLAGGTSDFMANARLGAANDIATKKFAITSSPTNFALNNTFSTVPNLTQSGQTALQNIWSQDAAMNLANLNYNNNVKLANMNQPSLLSQYGGLILGGVAGGAGSALGRGLL